MGERVLPDLLSLPVAATTKILAGALVALSGGYVTNATAATGLVCIGRAESTVDNTTGSAGALSIQVRQGSFKMASGAGVDAIAQTNVGQLCYAIDNQTVGLTSAGGTRSVAGTIVSLDTDGLPFVLCALSPAPVGTSLGVAPSLQTGTATLVAGTKTVSTGVTISASSKIFLQLNTPGGGTQGVKYKVPDASLVVGAPGTGAFAITATDNTGATVATDVSTVNFLIVGLA